MKKIVSLSKSILCVLYDKVAKSYGAPTTFINENVAKRSFGDLMNTEMYSAHKSDYELYKVGEFDNQSGVILICNLELVVRGDDFVNT